MATVSHSWWLRARQDYLSLLPLLRELGFHHTRHAAALPDPTAQSAQDPGCQPAGEGKGRSRWSLSGPGPGMGGRPSARIPLASNQAQKATSLREGCKYRLTESPPGGVPALGEPTVDIATRRTRLVWLPLSERPLRSAPWPARTSAPEAQGSPALLEGR